LEEAPTPIKLIIVEESMLFREGLRVLLDRFPDAEVVDDLPTVERALMTDKSLDVVVTDIWLQDGRGAGVVSRLHERFPEAAILVLTVIDDPVEIRAAFDAGARGYILKDATSGDVMEAIRRVAAGTEYLHPALGANLARLRTSSHQASTGSTLSPREREVLRLIALGHTNAAIATFLGVSLRTVEAHRGRIYQKLGLRTRAELVRHATQIGLTAEL
jgi:DNA-binding NarL/FixJ family response regulator